jgi:hypothetical protein
MAFFVTSGMQGRKIYSEKLFFSFQLSDRVPKENFYRRLGETLDLQFLYNDTRELYGKTGNPSIDPVVFFKLMLTGYLENITSYRRLIEHCSMRMDTLYFIGYDIDELLPWHSTISGRGLAWKLLAPGEEKEAGAGAYPRKLKKRLCLPRHCITSGSSE